MAEVKRNLQNIYEYILANETYHSGQSNLNVAINNAESKPSSGFLESDNDGVGLTYNEKVLKWLDKYIAGQEEAKKSLITIISTRDRRNKLKNSDLKDAIKPSHAVFHGPTGCGKSYLISKLSEYKNIPFIKTEATQYTEVGYVGRDVEMMIKDLIEKSVQIVRKKHFEIVKGKVLSEVHGQIIAILMKKNKVDLDSIEIDENKDLSDIEVDDLDEDDNNDNGGGDLPFDRKQFELLYTALINGELDDIEIEIEVSESSSPSSFGFDIPGAQVHMSAMNMSDMMNKILGKKNMKKLIVTVKEAIDLLTDEKSAKHLNENKIIKEAIHLAQTEGIIFIDEIDKIISNHNLSSRGEVSKEGVQRDLLPLLDGTTVSTKYGAVKTDHILFIAAGAFHIAKFSDLIPELQGRFPMSVRLHPLNKGHFVDILTNKKHSLIAQHKAMLEVDEVDLIFSDESIETIAEIAEKMNQEIENTGARRLRTIIDKILEDINFKSESYKGKKYNIDSEYIKKKMEKMVNEMDLRKFIL